MNQFPIRHSSVHHLNISVCSVSGTHFNRYLLVVVLKAGGEVPCGVSATAGGRVKKKRHLIWCNSWDCYDVGTGSISKRKVSLHVALHLKWYFQHVLQNLNWHQMSYSRLLKVSFILAKIWDKGRKEISLHWSNFFFFNCQQHLWDTFWHIRQMFYGKKTKQK